MEALENSPKATGAPGLWGDAGPLDGCLWNQTLHRKLRTYGRSQSSGESEINRAGDPGKNGPEDKY